MRPSGICSPARNVAIAAVKVVSALRSSWLVMLRTNSMRGGSGGAGHTSLGSSFGGGALAQPATSTVANASVAAANHSRNR